MIYFWQSFFFITLNITYRCLPCGKGYFCKFQLNCSKKDFFCVNYKNLHLSHRYVITSNIEKVNDSLKRIKIAPYVWNAKFFVWPHVICWLCPFVACVDTMHKIVMWWCVMDCDSKYFHRYFGHSFCVPKRVRIFRQMPWPQRKIGNTWIRSVSGISDDSFYYTPKWFPVCVCEVRKNGKIIA